MNAGDQRHGKWAGYNAGCREACCREAARRYQAGRHHDQQHGRPRRFDITGTRRRIRALMRIGWSAERIALQAGVSPARIYSLASRPELIYVYQPTRDRISRVYDALSGHPGPSKESVKNAIRLGYVSPLAWDDEAIDDPGALPVGLPGDTEEVGGYDESRVERRILGDRSFRLHRGESAEVVRRLVADGWSLNAIRRHTGLKPERYLERAA